MILLAFDWMNGGFVNCDFIGILLFSEIWDDFIAVLLAFYWVCYWDFNGMLMGC